MSIIAMTNHRMRVGMLLLSLSLLIFSIVIDPSSAYASTQATYYVSPNGSDSNPGTESAPFLTIAQAQNTVRTINGAMTGDIVVYLRGGSYAQGSTLAFTQADSGMNGNKVIYKAYPGETPIISGGLLETGVWTQIDSVKNIYRAAVPSDLDTRELYVNGVRAVRARSDYIPSGFAITSTGYTAPSSGFYSNMSSWGNRANIEFAFHGYDWQFSRCGVASIVGNAITMKQPCWNLAQNKHDITWIENAYELLDSPREWYLDRTNSYLYYIPSSDENMSTASVIAPKLESLVTMTGTSTTPIQNIQFDGITFADATNLRPNGNDGYPDAQGGIPFGYTFAPNMTVSYANGIGFVNGSFTRMGSEALYISNSQDITITGNKFIDNSHRALEIQATQNFTVSNNVVTKQGAEYVDAVAIRVLSSSGSVEHNEIYDVPYTAIERDYTGAIKIRYNYIHDYMLKILDGGGIYTNTTNPTLDSSNNTQDEFAFNYILHQPVGMAGIYLDDGSQNEYVHDNVVSGTPYSFLAKGSGEIVQNNYFDTGNYPYSCTSCTLSPNQVITNGQWPSAAVSIMNGAGLQPAYQHLKGSDNLLRAPHVEMTAYATSTLNGKFTPAMVLDDSSMTMWAAASGAPQSITLSLGDSYQVSGLEVMPRQDLIPYGSITSYIIFTSADGATFTQVAQGTWADDGVKKSVSFSAVKASFVRLQATTGVLGYVAAAGIDVVYQPDPDLIGNWKLNETTGTSASDISGYNKTGTLNGGAAWVTGIRNNGLSFNGTDSYVNIPDATNPTALTVSMWVKPAATTAQNLWVRTNASGATSASSSQLCINSSGKFQAYMFDGNTKSITGTTTVQAGVWYHVALTATNNGQMKLYVNGQPEGTAVSIGTMWAGGDRYWLGSNSDGGFGWFNGVADEVRLYSKALDDSEINSLYSEIYNLFLNPLRLTGYWKLDETSGTSAADASGQNDTATVYGTANWVPGLIGGALSLNGTNAYAQASSLVSTQIDSVTMSAWVKWNGATSGHQVIFNNGNTASSGYAIFLDHGNGDKLSLLAGGRAIMSSQTVLPTGQWTLVTAKRSSGTWSLYVNGSSVAITNSTTTPAVPSGVTTIGAAQGGVANFNGAVDDVRFFNTALDSNTIVSLYNTIPIPVAYWKLDETSGTSAADASGQNDTGTVYGTATWVTGVVGGALSLNGSNAYVQALSLASTQTDNITMSAWVKWNGSTSDHQMILNNGNSATSGYGIFLDHGNGDRLSVLAGGVLIMSSQTVLPTGQWMLVTATRSGGTWSLYVNGSSVAITNSTTTPVVPSGATTIGAAQGGIENFNGAVDDVRFYNSAMSSSTILDFYRYPGAAM